MFTENTRLAKYSTYYDNGTLTIDVPRVYNETDCSWAAGTEAEHILVPRLFPLPLSLRGRKEPLNEGL